MRGRKRRLGRREDNGRIQRDDKPEDVMGVALAYRARLVGHDHARDQRAGSALGRLCLRGIITPSQYDAGVSFAYAVARYAATMGVPVPTPRGGGLSLLSCGGRSLSQCADCAVAQDDKRLICDRCQSAIRAYQDAYAEVMVYCGRHALMALRTVISIDEDTDAVATIGALRQGLTVLAKYYKHAERRAA